MVTAIKKLLRIRLILAKMSLANAFSSSSYCRLMSTAIGLGNKRGGAIPADEAHCHPSKKRSQPNRPIANGPAITWAIRPNLDCEVFGNDAVLTPSAIVRMPLKS